MADLPNEVAYELHIPFLPLADSDRPPTNCPVVERPEEISATHAERMDMDRVSSSDEDTETIRRNKKGWRALRSINGIPAPLPR